MDEVDEVDEVDVDEVELWMKSNETRRYILVVRDSQPPHYASVCTTY